MHSSFEYGVLKDYLLSKYCRQICKHKDTFSLQSEFKLTVPSRNVCEPEIKKIMKKFAAEEEHRYDDVEKKRIRKQSSEIGPPP